MAQAVEQFGKYILLERLAAGGMAEVYLARSTGAVGVNKFVAIKRILPQHSDHQEFIEMFKEEAKIAVNLNHGNVVAIYDFGVERNQFFLVMEYVEGRNLRQILNELKKSNTQFTIEQIVFMVKEVAAGLDHAHRCIDGTTGRPLNITHRDMSPQNIMVSFEGEVKIIDFGIAKAENQLEATKAGTLKGKFGYMSPEQADGQVIDLRTDVFSLGIVLWELLANDRLFTSNSEAAILRKVRECQIPSIRKINPSVPPELERIVNKTLAKDKSLRYQTGAALHRDLNRFLNTQYPEFSPHDFSVFMKNAFSAAFLEQRKKLVEFAKIQPTPQVEDRTIVTQTDVRGPATPVPPRVPSPSSTIGNEDDAFSEKLNLDTSTDIRVSLDGLKDNNKKNRLSGVDTTGYTKTRTGQSTQTGIHKIPSNSGPIRSTSGRTSSGPNYAVIAILFLVVVGGGWWAYSNILHKPVTKTMASTTPAAKVPAAPQAVAATEAPAPQTEQAPAAAVVAAPSPAQENAAAADYAVTIYSYPEKAHVFIDDVDTGEFTPLRKTMKANTAFNLRLVKEGYTDLVTTVTPTYEAYSFTGTMQRYSRFATLLININNGGAKPILKIGGVPVQIKAPGEPYFIQAEVDIKVQAYNQTTGLSAEKTVHVPTDHKEIIDLFLK